MTADVFIFWFISLVIVCSALGMILIANPIFSSLFLVMSMVGVAGMFVTLGAYFIAGVQLIVYAGAVMVLFVMVLMLFDLKLELRAFSRGKIVGALKVITIGTLAGLIVGALTMNKDAKIDLVASAGLAQTTDTTKTLSEMLFTKHIFAFEALGVLLLVIAVGTVSLARSKGGTHAD